MVGGAVQEILPDQHAKGGFLTYEYTPQIEFRYAVSGKDYTAGPPSDYVTDTYDHAATMLAGMYAPGTHHPLLYNPRDPRVIRFGIIDFGAVAFSLLLIFGGVTLSVAGSYSLIMTYWQRAKLARAMKRARSAELLAYVQSARQKPSAAKIYCASCGRPVQPNEDTCPNCLKSLRAA